MIIHQDTVDFDSGFAVGGGAADGGVGASGIARPEPLAHCRGIVDLLRGQFIAGISGSSGDSGDGDKGKTSPRPS